MKSVGICGTDVKFNKYGRCGPFSLEGKDMVIGHESSGIVSKLGEGVTNLKIGEILVKVKLLNVLETS